MEVQHLKYKNCARISRSALRQNYESICSRLTKGRPDIPPAVIATVKANGYGHGVDIVTEVLGDAGCRFFAVSSEQEALEVRQLETARGRHPQILILGYTFPENAPVMAEADIQCAVVSIEHAMALSAAATNRPLQVHIKLDTGMHRLGFACDTPERAVQTIGDIEKIAADPHLQITGIFTHFACCDDEKLSHDPQKSKNQMTETQFSRYKRVVDGLQDAGIPTGLRHASNSAAILAYAPAWLDAVRAGIILYGMTPDGTPWHPEDGFRPVMTLASTVAHIQHLRKGEHVGYGATYTADEDRTLATLPIGYGDGWIRQYRGVAVRIDGKEYPIVGRICMDYCMVDITGAEDRIHVGDTAILFGDDLGESVGALAHRADTIVYECTCLVSPRVCRVPTE